MNYSSLAQLKRFSLIIFFTLATQNLAPSFVWASPTCANVFLIDETVLGSIPQRIVPLIERYWTAEETDFVAQAIASGTSLDVLVPFRIFFENNLDGNTLNLVVLTVASKESIKGPSWFPIIKLGEKGRPRGLDSTLIKFIAGVIKGISLLSQQRPELKFVSIQAPSVQNPALIEYLESLGMELSQSNGFIAALKSRQISLGSTRFYQLTLSLPNYDQNH